MKAIDKMSESPWNSMIHDNMHQPAPRATHRPSSHITTMTSSISLALPYFLQQ
jgi:hypothetical protein